MTCISPSTSSTKELQSNSSVMYKWCLKPSTNAYLTRLTTVSGKEDVETEKSLLKLLRWRTASKERMKIFHFISHGKRLAQPKHAHGRPSSLPSRQSSCNIPLYSLKKQDNPGQKLSRIRSTIHHLPTSMVFNTLRSIPCHGTPSWSVSSYTCRPYSSMMQWKS